MKNNKRLKERNIYFNKLIAFKDTDSKKILLGVIKIKFSDVGINFVKIRNF